MASNPAQHRPPGSDHRPPSPAAAEVTPPFNPAPPEAELTSGFWLLACDFSSLHRPPATGHRPPSPSRRSHTPSNPALPEAQLTSGFWSKE